MRLEVVGMAPPTAARTLRRCLLVLTYPVKFSDDSSIF
jgi:hypothetical protein